jgi:hypothetical protein
MSDLDSRKFEFPQDAALDKAKRKEAKAYKEKHGESVTKKDYAKYKESFKPPTAHYDLAKPLSFSDYKAISEFYGKSMAKDASLELVMKAGLDPEKYRSSVTKSSKGTQDFRKGGMVLSTVDNRKKK